MCALPSFQALLDKQFTKAAELLQEFSDQHPENVAEFS